MNGMTLETASKIATLSVASIVITKQPENVTAKVDDVVTFRVEAEGEELTYQWKVQQPGETTWTISSEASATTNELTFTAQSHQDGSRYYCEVKNADGTKRTNTVTLVVNEWLKIIKQPENITTDSGVFVSFRTEAAGEGVTYAWQYCVEGSSEWKSANEYTGYNTNEISVPVTPSRDGMRFKCILNSTLGEMLETEIVTLDVLTGSFSSYKFPEFTVQPVMFVGSLSETAFFEVYATGVEVVYQWYINKSDGNGWVICTGEGNNTNKLYLEPGTWSNGYEVKCLATDRVGEQAISAGAQAWTTSAGLVSPHVALGDGWYGRQVTVSAWVKSDSWTDGGTGFAISTYLGTPESLEKRYAQITVIDVNGNIVDRPNVGGDTPEDGEWIRVWATFTLNEDFLYGGSTDEAVRDCTALHVKFNKIGSGRIQIMKPKAEWGNKVTDWIQSQDDVLDTAIKQAELLITPEKIEMYVKETTFYSETQASITLLNDEITNKVSQTEFEEGLNNTRETIIQQTEKDITLAVSNMQVGARNILKRTKELPLDDTNTNLWSVDNGIIRTESEGSDGSGNYGCFDWDVTGQEIAVSNAARSPVSKLPSGWQGRTAVISAWVYSDNWSTIDGGMHWRIHLTQGNRTTAFKYNEIQILTSGGAIASGARGDDAVNGKWRRVSAQFAFTDEDMSDGGSGQFDQATHCWVEFVCTQNVQMSFMQPKLEFGNVCTDWSPSPEDADADLVTLNDRISNAEIKMTDDSIISTVTTSETYLNDRNEYREAIAKNAEDLAGYITSNNAELEVIQNQIDGSISTWFYAAVPTVANEPALEWTTNTDRDTHLGDLYYDTNTGYCYRWQKTGDTYNWQRIKDTDVTKALSDAANAQDTADNKRRVFVNQPIPPYDIGDIWTQGANGDIMVAKVSRTSGSYVASDWQKASKYTDDTLAVQNRTSIAQLDERITLSAERVEEIGGEVEGMQSSIDLIPSQITAAVGEMRIGGSNYLKDSSISVTTTANIVGRYYFGNAKPRSGYQHTIRIWGTLASGSTTFRIYVYNSSGTETLFGEATLQDDGTYVKTGNWTVANPSYIQINKYPSNSNTSTITKIKLEEGSVPTDWTPYNEEFRAGSSVVITEEEVNISTSKFGVDIVGSDGETNMLTIDENGALSVARRLVSRQLTRLPTVF